MTKFENPKTAAIAYIKITFSEIYDTGNGTIMNTLYIKIFFIINVTTE